MSPLKVFLAATFCRRWKCFSGDFIVAAKNSFSGDILSPLIRFNILGFPFCSSFLTVATWLLRKGETSRAGEGEHEGTTWGLRRWRTDWRSEIELGTSSAIRGEFSERRLQFLASVFSSFFFRLWGGSPIKLNILSRFWLIQWKLVKICVFWLQTEPKSVDAGFALKFVVSMRFRFCECWNLGFWDSMSD